jgi:hypothetical protein
MGNRWPSAQRSDTFTLIMMIHPDSINSESGPLNAPAARNPASILDSPLFAGFLIPLLGFLPAAIYLRHYSIDDVFISFRYAAHLAEGHGLSWNIGGPPVEGFSNFLWVIVLAGARLLGFEIVSASEIFGFCLGIANVWLFGILCRRLWPALRYWWLPVLLLALNPEWVMWTMSGLEIGLFCLFLLISTVALTVDRRQRIWLLSIGLAGLSLTRPEGFALAMIPLLCGWFADRRQPLRERLLTYGIPAIVLTVATLGLVLFRLSYFGYPLPNTVYAKASRKLLSLGRAAEWMFFAIPFLLAWAFAIKSARPLRHPWVFTAALALVLAQVVIVLPVNPVMYFMHRYQIAFLPLLILPLPFLLERVRKWLRWAGPILSVLILLWSMQGWPESSRRSEAVKHTVDKQGDVAAYLLTLPGEPTIAMCDAGRIPFWTDLPTYDVFGLCDAEWGHEYFSVASLLARQPSAYIMSADLDSANNYRPFIGRDNLVMQTPEFRQSYGLGQIFPKREGEIAGDYGYAVFVSVAWARQHGLDLKPLESP